MQAGAEPDAALIDASRRGDRTAFAQIVERYQRAVYAVAFSNVRDRALSDDLTQDTFVAAWRTLGELREVRRLPAWLCGIARNLARDACKRRRRESVEVPEVAAALTPFEALSDADSERLISAALARVPDVYREPLVLFYFEQHSVEEVARMLGLSAQTTNKRLSRGRRYLAEHVTAIVERGLVRRGPRADVAAGVLAAIGVLGSASHVDASPVTEGSTMFSKLALAAIVTTTIVVGIGVLAADPSRDRTSTSAARAAAPAPAKPVVAVPSKAAPAAVPAAKPAPKPTTTPSRPPTLPVAKPVVVPDCTAVATHLAELWIVPLELRKRLPATKRAALIAERTAVRDEWCKTEHWSETRRLCILDADEYARANTDCTDVVPATAAEVAALPPNLRCDALAHHVHELLVAPDGKFGIIKTKMPDRAAHIDKLALGLRAEIKTECDERPWSVEIRRCIAAATTHAAYSDCNH